MMEIMALVRLYAITSDVADVPGQGLAYEWMRDHRPPMSVTQDAISTAIAWR